MFLSNVRRAFRLKLFPKNPRDIPQLKAFQPGSFGASKRPRQHVPSSLGVGIVDGRCLPVYWSEGPAAVGINLEMLKTVMWPSVRVPTGCQKRVLVPAGRRAGARHTRSHGFPQVEVRRPTALSEDPAPLAGGHPTVRLCPAWPLATSISRSRRANAGDPIR